MSLISLDLKVVNDLHLLISSRREFHNTGALDEKALWFHPSITSKVMLEERNVLGGM